MRKLLLPYCITMLLLVCSTLCNGQTIRYYVDSAKGNDANAGLSWSTAFRNLTMAIAVADTSKAAEVDIWVAKGTYRPIDGISKLPADQSDTAFAFYRGDGVGKALKLYGGFRGNEISINGRDTNHVTYLTGTISKTQNTYHIAVIAGLAPNADSVVLNGFTINNGYAAGAPSKVYNGDTLLSGFGGGIYLVKDSTDKLLISHCKVVLNENGLSAVGSNLTIDRCSFLSNNGFIGGGVYINGGKPEIKNSIFFNNNNASGAAMFLGDCEGSVSNCRFISNNAAVGTSPGHAGGIYVSAAAVRITKCVFDGNYTAGDGYAFAGALYMFSQKTTTPPSVDSCLFINNAVHATESGNSYGGAIVNEYCNPSISNCVFKNNLADSWGDDYDGGGTSGGGAIYNDHAASIIYNCSFSGNVARGYGYDAGGVSGYGYGYGLGGAINNNQSFPTISNCSFKSDTAQGVTDSSTFAGYGYGYGGGLYNFESIVSINNCTFDSEAAVSNLKMLYGGGYEGGGYGGAICNTNTSPVLINSCSFKSNSATTHGGAIFHTDDTLTVKNSQFSSNTAMNGGAINFTYSMGTGAGAIFRGYNNVFVKNIATLGVGGAINSDMGAGGDTLINNLFVNNKAVDSNGGGAMDVAGSNHYIYNNTFYADSAIGGLGSGGALHFENKYGVFNIANNIFNKNFGVATSADTGIMGGGVYFVDHNIYTGDNAGFINTGNLPGADSIWGTTDDGLELQKCSAARNAGALRYVMVGELTDVTGSSRVESDSIDIGAYETNPLGKIAGVADVCTGFYLTLSDTVIGGTWMSKDTTIATINSGGVLKGVSAGTDTILYAVNGLCSSDTIAAIVHVHDAIDAGTITGITTICVGDVTMLTDTMANGSWSATNGNASVSNGIVTGIKPGRDTIKYTNSCAMGVAIAIVTINPLPQAGKLTGADSVCLGDTMTLYDTVNGGVWSSQNGLADVSLNGVITGLSVGIDTIFYSVSTACGSAIVKKGIVISNCREGVNKIANNDGGYLKTFPNPNGGTFNIFLSSGISEAAQLQITDVTGTVISTFEISTNKNECIKVDAPAGIYFLSVKLKDKRYNSKVIIQ